jgi:hypothetical protein
VYDYKQKEFYIFVFRTKISGFAGVIWAQLRPRRAILVDIGR